MGGAVGHRLLDEQCRVPLEGKASAIRLSANNSTEIMFLNDSTWFFLFLSTHLIEFSHVVLQFDSRIFDPILVLIVCKYPNFTLWTCRGHRENRESCTE
eukprot:2948973-Amphidinium_carterae.1